MGVKRQNPYWVQEQTSQEEKVVRLSIWATRILDKLSLIQNSAYYPLGLYHMIKKLLNTKTNAMQGAMLIAFSSFASRVLGLIRDGLFSGMFGRSAEADVYFAAFKIPDMIFNFLIAGGLSIVFLPVLSEYMEKSEEDGWEMANNTINIITFLLVCFSIICFVFTPLFLELFLPGFSSAQLEVAIPLTRLLLLSPIFFGASTLFSSVLMYYKKFVSYALAPVLYNISIIAGIIFLGPEYGVLGVGFGVVIGAFLHMATQIPAIIQSGYRPSFSFNFADQSIIKIGKLTIPRTIATAGRQVNEFFVTGLSSMLGTGSIAILNYANNIQYLPVGFLAMPFSISTFPDLSKAWAANNIEKFSNIVSSTLGKIVSLVIPASVILFVLRAQVVRIILGSLGNNFDWIATRLTAATLGIFCFSLLASAIIPLISRAFFAAHNTKTPTIISLIAIGINIYLALLFVSPEFLPNLSWIVGLLDLQGIENVSVVFIPLAFTISAIVQALLLLFFFVKKVNFNIKELFITTLKVSFISIISGIITYFALYVFEEMIPGSFVFNLFVQTMLSGIAGLTMFLFSAHYMGCYEVENLLKSMFKRKDGNS